MGNMGTHTHKGCNSHSEPVGEAVNNDGPGENSNLDRIRWALHHIRCRLFQTKAKSRGAASKLIGGKKRIRIK